VKHAETFHGIKHVLRQFERKSVEGLLHQESVLTGFNM